MKFLSQFPQLLLHFLCTSPLLFCLYALPGLAQPITPDGSTPTNITQTGQQIDISGGTIAGPNQFHSFDQFNVPSEHTANFQAPQPIENVMGRVTGGNLSAIEGTVRVSGSDANLYLMNPAGIIFGEDARLDVPGSFNATSANGIGFEGGGEFSAEGQNNYHDLATSPNSFNFEGNNGDIVNHGDLAVPAGERLNLVGGTVENTGRLSAPGGGVNLIAVPGRETVRIRQNGMVLELEVTDNGQGLAATDLPERLTGGEGHANTLEVSENGSVRLTRQPRGTVTVRGTGEKPARIESDRLQVQGQQVLIENATIDSTGVINQVILQSSQGSTAIVNSQINLSNLAGIGGLLELAGQSVQVEQSQMNLRGSTTGLIRLESRSGNTQVSQSRITIATPATPNPPGTDPVITTQLNDRVLAGQLDILSSSQVVIASSDLAAYGVRVGGDFQGQGEFVTAQDVFVDADSAIVAGTAWETPLDTAGLPTNPQNPSDPVAMAGRVIVWADDKTRFLGYLHNPAGFAEISGKRELDLGSNWDQRINVGELLLDPTNITITTGAGTFGDQTISNFLENTGDLTITTAGGGTQAGDITVNGGVAINWTSANSLTLEADRSISFGNNSSITATGSGSIVLEANQGVTPATGTFNGIDLTSSNVFISSNSGDITLSGKGGTVGGGGSNGIYLLSGSTIQTTSGNITLNGQGQASGFNNLGLRIEGTETLVTAESGSITLNGTGGDNNTAQHGIVIFSNAQVTSTGMGATAATIALNGIGGNATGQGFHQGIRIFSNARVSTVDGDMNLTGTGGNDPNRADQPGIYLDAALESTGTGNIILNGTGGQSSAQGYGVWVDTAGSVTATGSGTITIAGTGGSGNNTLSGILVSGDIEANTGNITLTGTGGTGTGGNNWGIGVTGGATIASTSTALDVGAITLIGQGGSGTSDNVGIQVIGGSQINAVHGNITFTGTGGAASGETNIGIQFQGSFANSTGTGEITLEGTGGTGTQFNHGINIRNVNGAVNPPAGIRSAQGAIAITGNGGQGSNSRGIQIGEAADILSTDTAAIVLTGTVQGNNTGIQSFGAAKIGGDSLTTGRDVSFFADVLDLSAGTTLQGLGTLTIAPSTPGIDFAVDFSVAPESFAGITLGRLDTNTTTVSGDTNLSASTTILGGAIDFSGSITSNDNDVTFQAGRNMVLNPGSSINTGAGDINLSANQGATPAIGSVAGIDLNGASLATTTGNIELIGRGGVGALNRLAGVLFQNNSQISTQTGTIDLTGTGGDGSATGTSANWGVALLTGSSITSSGTGATITLQGTGGTGANDQVGVLLRDTNTSITSSEGDITLDGTAGSSTTAGANFGVAVQSGAVIESTGTGTNAATITLTGTGGTVTSLIYGVILADAGSTITAIDGDITITGIGGSALVGNGHGIVLRGGAIESTGTDANAAQITLQGTGGNGPGNNFRGIVLVENTQITSISGDINLEGTGGSGDANNAGVQVSGSTIRSTGTGATVADITITGTAGSGTDPQTGLIVATGSAITTVDGNITALGQSNSTDPIAQGINLNASEISSSGSGLIRLTVTDPTTGDAFAALGDAILGNSTGTGDITITADTIALDSALIQGSGILTLQPNTPTTAIGIGDNVPGVFNLTATELNNITPTFSSINVGRSDGTGSIRVGINIDPAVASLVNLLGGSDLGGGDNDNLWTVTGVNTGTINGINFQNFTTLLGGGLTDTVQGSTADEDFLIANPDEVQVGNLTFTRVETLDGVGGSDRFTLAGGTLSGAITGGAGIDTLVAGNTPTDFVVTGTDSGTVNTITGGFSSMENLTGGTADDRFSFAGGTLSGIIDGGAGNDSLLGSTGDDRFELAATPNAGTFSGTSFINLEAIDGNTGTDTVTDSNNIGATFNLTGTDNAFVEPQSNLTFTNVEIAIGSPTATNTIAGTTNTETFSLTGENSLQVAQIAFSNINAIQGNGGDDVLQGTAGSDRFTLTALDTGAISGLTFTGIPNVEGLGGEDTLIGFDQDTAIVITALDSGTHSQLSGSFAGIENLITGTGNDTFTLAGGILTGSIDGSTGTDTFTADNVENIFTFTGADSGTITGIDTGFSNIENFIGGIVSDRFLLAGGTVSGSIDGNIGTDFLTADNVASDFILTSENTGTLTGIGQGFINIENLTGGTADDTFTLASGTLTGAIDGSIGTDTFTADNVENTFTFTVADGGTITGIGTGFSNIENFIGGTVSDRFLLAGGTVSGSIDGNIGTDFLTADNVASDFVLTAENTGTLTGIGQGFTNIENLIGGTADDRFTLAGGTLTGAIDGSTGADTLTADNVENTFTFTGIDSGTITGIGTGFSNIENFIGGTSSDRFLLAGGTVSGSIDGNIGMDFLTADNVASDFVLTSENTGTLTGIGQVFINIENLIGGTADDRFTLAGGTLTGAIDGGDGTETLTADNVASDFVLTAENTGTLTGIGQEFTNIENLIGGTADDTFTLAGGTLTGAIDGGTGTETLIADNLDSAFVLTAENTGTLTGIGQGFSNIENLTGGTGNDRFTFTDGVSLAGIIDGSEGSDTLVASNQGVLIDISGTDNGTYGDQLILWQNIENIVGGTGNDTFLLSATTLTGSLDGAGGIDTIVGDAVPNTFVLETTNGGTVTGILGTFSNIENLVGNIESDTFILASAGNLTGVLDGSDNLDTLIGDDNGNLFVLTGLDTGYVNDRIPNFVNIENLTGGSGSDTFFVEDQVGLSGVVDGGTGIDYLIANNIANVNIEGFVLPELINLDSFNAPEKGFYDVYVGDGERKVIEVADLDQSQILAYNPEDFGDSMLREQTIANVTNTEETNTEETNTGDFTPDGDNELHPLEAGLDAGLENAEGRVPNRTSGDSSSESDGSESDSAGSDSSGSDSTSATGTAGDSRGSVNSTANNELAGFNAGEGDADENLLDPNANNRDSDRKLPNPNTNNSEADAPDPTASANRSGAEGAGNGSDSPIASAPGITTEAPTEGREIPLALMILGVGAVVGGTGAAIVLSKAIGGAAGGATAQGSSSSTQNLDSTGGGKAILGSALAASSAQQQLAEMKIALEPRVATQPTLKVRKQDGVSLTQTAIDLADQDAIEEGLLGEAVMEKVATLKEFFGIGEEEEPEEEVNETETPETSDPEALEHSELPEESESLAPETTVPTPEVSAEAQESEEATSRIEAVKAKIAEAAQRAGLPPASLDYLYTAAIEKIGEILEEIEIAPDILSTAWSKSFELMEYRDLLKDAAPDEAVMVPLVNHEVLSEHAPSIDLKFKETLVGQFEVVINFGSVLEGVMIAIEDRKIKRIQVGTATAAGGIEFAGITLLEVPEKSLDWNQVIDLGEGIAIDDYLG